MQYQIIVVVTEHSYRCDTQIYIICPPSAFMCFYGRRNKQTFFCFTALHDSILEPTWSVLTVRYEMDMYNSG